MSYAFSHFALDQDHSLIATYDPSHVTKTTNSKFMFITYPPSTSTVCVSGSNFTKGRLLRHIPFRKFLCWLPETDIREICNKNSKETGTNDVSRTSC